MASGIGRWLDDLFRASVVSMDTSLVRATLENSRTGISAFDRSFAKLRFIDGDGVVRLLNNSGVTSETLARYARDFRLANFRKIFTGLGVETTVRAVDENAFKSIARSTVPDYLVEDLAKVADQGGRIHPGLKVVGTGTGDELRAALSAADQIKVESFYKTIGDAAQKKGSSIAKGTFTAMVVTATGVLLWDAIAKTIRERNGCFLMRTVNQTTTTCKIQNRSCNDALGTDVPVCTPDQLKDVPAVNPYFLITKVKQIQDETIIRALEELLGKDVFELPVDQLLNTEGVGPKLVAFIRENNNRMDPYVPTCPSDKPDCFMCNPTASAIDPKFIDVAGLASNVHIQCINNTTAIEAITDVATGIGVNLFDSVGNSTNNSFKMPIVIAIVVILILLIILGAVLKFRGSRNNNNNDNTNGGRGQTSGFL